MRGRVGGWWPPLLLALVPLAGLAPTPRDVPDFFAPMRSWTAAQLAEGSIPWLNPLNGCGEPWFANPETGILYPVTWIHLVLPTGAGLAVEIGLHLALFALGIGLLARAWGASESGRTIAELAAWSAGPVVATAGVLNNLLTLGWLPWMTLAARRQDRWAVPLLALCVAAAWLGGEPQLWALGVGLAVVAGRFRPRVLAGVIVGVAVLAVQLVPFGWWVAEGDRGPGGVQPVTPGALQPADWVGLVRPGLSGAGDVLYLESLFLGAPILALIVLGARRRIVVAGIATGLLLLASLPALGGPGLYETLTLGLVRFPSRFAIVGVAMLLPLAGLGWGRWREGDGRWVAWTVAGLTVLLPWSPTPATAIATALVPAAVLAVGAASPSRHLLRTAAVAVGLAATMSAALPVLGLSSADILGRGTVWTEARALGRLWSPSPGWDDLGPLSRSLSARRAWPVGYLNLEHGVAVAGSPSPILHRTLRDHLAAADRGPQDRWWLDTLGARWVVLPSASATPPDFAAVAVRSGRTLWANPRALATVAVRRSSPGTVDVPPSPEATVTLRWPDHPGSLEVTASTLGPASLWISASPIAGWRWRLDGEPVSPRPGPGVVTSIPLPAGTTTIEGRYRPPGIRSAGAVSGLTVVGLVGWSLWAVGRGSRGGRAPAGV